MFVPSVRRDQLWVLESLYACIHQIYVRTPLERNLDRLDSSHQERRIKKRKKPKSELEWSFEEDKQSSNNWKAFNAIFNGVSPTQLKNISTTEFAKDAWNILQVEFEGTIAMQNSRIELLISKFENLRMEENETIG